MKKIFMLALFTLGCSSSVDKDDGQNDMLCPGDARACAFDSDCFVRECTHSTCERGRCLHNPYPDGSYCFDGIDTDIFAGVCAACACVPLQPGG